MTITYSAGYSELGTRKVVTRAFPYRVIVIPAIQPISLSTVKSYLDIDPADTSQDDILNLMIETVTQFAEKFTKRDFITRTNETTRDFFTDQFVLRRSPLQTINTVERLVSGSFVIVDDTIYSNTIETDYSKIFLNDGESWPDDKNDIEQSIRIEFKTGFGDADIDVPAELRLALLQHVADLFSNRGDCSCDGAENALPATSSAIYKQFRIMEVSVKQRLL